MLFLYVATAIIMIVILAVLVLIHEFGHFIVAKKNGIYVEEFGFGFPPRLWGIKKGETLYSINLIPLGGFVKVYGEEFHEMKLHVDPKLKNRAFVNKKPWQKISVLVAGVFMNLILGVAIFYFLLGTNHFLSEPLPVLSKIHFAFGRQEGQVVFGYIMPKSPAAQAGIHAEDAIISYKYQNESNWHQVFSPSDLIKVINNSQGNLITFSLQNIQNGQTRTITVQPKYDEKQKRYLVGAYLMDTVILKYETPKEKLFSGFMHAYNVIDYNVETIAYLIKQSYATKNIAPVSESVSGPVGILGAIYNILQSSGTKLVTNLLNLTALLSISLGFVNILPFPALDGGRVVFVLYEWITRRRVNATFERYLNMIGFSFLLLLMLVITGKDILNIFVK